jgi:hypothetical protein
MDSVGNFYVGQSGKLAIWSLSGQCGRPQISFFAMTAINQRWPTTGESSNSDADRNRNTIAIVDSCFDSVFPP